MSKKQNDTKLPNTSPHLNISGTVTAQFVEKVTETPNLSTGARTLLVNIICKAGKKGVMWHRNETLAQRLGTTVRTIQNWLAELLKEGAILEVVTNQDPPKNRRYLSPYTTRLPDVLSQLEHLGVKILTNRGENSFMSNDIKTDPKRKSYPKATRPKKRPNIQENICSKEDAPSNVIPIHR